MSVAPPTDPHIKLFVGPTQKARIQYAATTLAHSRWVGSWLHSQILRAISAQEQGATGPPRRTDPERQAEPRSEELRIRLSTAEKVRADGARRAAGYAHITHWAYDWLDYYLSVMEADLHPSSPPADAPDQQAQS